MKSTLQWLKDELESHGNAKKLEMTWEEFDKLIKKLESKTGTKLK